MHPTMLHYPMANAQRLQARYCRILTIVSAQADPGHFSATHVGDEKSAGSTALTWRAQRQDAYSGHVGETKAPMDTSLGLALMRPY